MILYLENTTASHFSTLVSILEWSRHFQAQSVVLAVFSSKSCSNDFFFIADIESQDKTYLINNLESVKENLDNKVVGFEETLENRDKSYAESLEKIKALENQINGLVAQNSERTRNEQDFWQTKILNYIKKVSDLEGTIQKSDEKLETRNTEIKACKHNFEQAQQEITRLTKNSADTHNKQCSEKEELIKREQNEVKLAEGNVFLL